MERARGDEQHVVGLDHAVLGADGAALDQRQEVPLHALARHVRAHGLGAAADLVDLVDEDDAVLLRVRDRAGLELLLVDHARRFLVGERLERFADAQLARLRAPAAHALEDLLELLRHLLHAGWAHDLEPERHGAQLDLDLALVERALAQHLAELLARVVAVRQLRQQRVEDPLLGRVGGARTDLGHFLLARLLHRDVHQLLDDRVHLAADVADLGELGGLDLDEGRARELREAARDLGLADAGRPDHEDVLGRDLLAQRLVDLHAAPAVPSAIATERLAAAWPTMCLSSSWTISRGVIVSNVSPPARR